MRKLLANKAFVTTLNVTGALAITGLAVLQVRQLICHVHANLPVFLTLAAVGIGTGILEMAAAQLNKKRI